MDDRAQKIRENALRLGFSKCGIISVDDVKGYKERLDERVAEFPQSSLMYHQFYPLADVRRKFPWARSLVVCVFDYSVYYIPEVLRGRIGTAYLFDGRKDKRAPAHIAKNELTKYMESIGLKVGRDDGNGITSLRYAAEKAGLGKVRKNNFFYTENGSRNAIDVFAIDEELELKEKTKLKECPDDCDRCVSACPTGSLAGPYSMHPMRCVSFITSIGGGMTDLSVHPFAEEIGNWVYGCDECQDACPFNKDMTGGAEFPGVAEIADKLSLENIIDMDDNFYLNVVQPKFWYLGPEMKWVWITNALNAMKNGYQKKYDKAIKKCLADPNERVRGMAEWVCGSLNIKL